jgi:serine protein kinase
MTTPAGGLPNAQEIIRGISERSQSTFTNEHYILSFSEYLQAFMAEPELLSRNAAKYLCDMIRSFGSSEEASLTGRKRKRRFKLFSEQRAKFRQPIIGQEAAQEQLIQVLEQFVRQGKVDKLIMLHGPNGSSKSSTVEMLALGLEDYSKTPEGAIYRFNWVFPAEKIASDFAQTDRKQGPIGFGDSAGKRSDLSSYAHISEDDTMCKIVSEFKENPIFLLPAEERVQLFKKAFSGKHGRQPLSEEIPTSLEAGALSSKSRKILDALVVAYKGDFEKALKHVQVERFIMSARYRAGIATVEPQMNIDASDRQLTMDKNLQNLPSVLQNIRLFEPAGELIDANRGFIEFSDLLKRPIEAYKYLLTTIEKMQLNLPSGIASLDMVMFATSNEKHLDAFKSSPDWPSFKGRIELVRVPYLLSSIDEAKIYAEDVRIIEQTKKVGPHAVDLLAKWAVLTRLRQPDPEAYEFSSRGLISKLDPFEKLALYDNLDSDQKYSVDERRILKKICPQIQAECQSSVAYEGRFGASPREMKMLLYFAAQNTSYDMVSALAVFDELDRMLKDRTVYDYLQFETRGHYHDVGEFLRYIRRQYAERFHEEFLASLNLFDESQYLTAFRNYLNHVVAGMKGEKIENPVTGTLEDPSDSVMEEIESLLGQPEARRSIREGMISKMASWKLDNPKDELHIKTVFHQELTTIASRIYESKKDIIQRILDGMLTYDSDDYNHLEASTKTLCERTFDNLSQKFGYSRRTSWDSLIFLRNFS